MLTNPTVVIMPQSVSDHVVRFTRIHVTDQLYLNKAGGEAARDFIHRKLLALSVQVDIVNS